jgi:hypothetical protein
MASAPRTTTAAAIKMTASVFVDMDGSLPVDG